MFKRLRIYYLYTALPFVVLLLAGAFYFEPVMKTLRENPHPQINYAIFAITLIGGILILMNAQRVLQEAAKLDEFSLAMRSGADASQLQSLALNYDVDIAYVLRMIAASRRRSISHQEQIALETELNKAGIRLSKRNALPQFLTSLLVGLGLLGTFIGLLATLDDIALLISSFSNVNVGVDNPIDVFRNMVERMRAPMRSMGIAFSASMYGLMGSIVLGFMMVSVKRCTHEVMSFLGSEIAQHIELALSKDGFAYSKGAIERIGEGQEPGQGEGAAVPATGKLLVEDGADAKFRRELATEEVRILRRIEERLNESSRLQDRALQAELDNFSKQRAEMLRSMSEHSETVSQFRGELQRVGRQLGTILNLMERGNADMMSQLNDHFSELIQTTARQGQDLGKMTDMMARMTDDSIEFRGAIAEMMDRLTRSQAPEIGQEDKP